jgi:hypothetical protein
MTELNARFAVDGWTPRPVEGLTDNWIGTVEMHKTFTSGLVGTSVALFVSSGETEGARAYFAAERITASLAGSDEVGSVTVYHGGLDASPDAFAGQVVPQSGTGPFTGWSGPARIVHDDEGPYFVFTVD